MSKPLSRPIIERARALIADEAHWCRAALARDERGWPTDPTDATALKRCAYGALVAAAFELVGDLKHAHILADAVAKEVHGPSSLINTNDSEGHAAVLAVFDKALAAA
jgi:hypothetical protein